MVNLNLEPDYYFSPSVFSTERFGLFTTTWQLLGPVSRLAHPGDYVSEDIAGIKILAIRGDDGVLRAFRNVCRHRGAQLIGDGTGVCRTVRCPYHNWVYDHTGTLKHAPWFGEEQQFDLRQWSLQSISIEEWRNLVFVAINPDQTLVKQLSETVSTLAHVEFDQYRFDAEHRVSFTANWKVYTDNFVEGYHIPGIHPEFYASIDFEQFRTEARDGLVEMSAPPKKDLFYKGKWYWMWPNWTLSLFEGGMNTSRINPMGYNQSELIYHFYFADADQNNTQTREETIRKNLEVVRQDFRICEETHRNYENGNYSPGPLSPRHEQGVAYFQERYRSAISKHD